MSDVSARAMSPNLSADKPEEGSENISVASLLRKLAAFTVFIFLFYLAVPLPEVNQTIVSGLGLEGTWYRDVPVAICVAAMNSAMAVAAFRLVR